MILDTNPDELGKAVGVSGEKMRKFLRDKFPRPQKDKNKPWDITLDMIVQATRHFS
jgi:hypothetical protein